MIRLAEFQGESVVCPNKGGKCSYCEHYAWFYERKKEKLRCHAQSVAATNRVTEQLSWLAVESFFVLFNKLDGQSYW
jgi:hypothetical protein